MDEDGYATAKTPSCPSPSTPPLNGSQSEGELSATTTTTTRILGKHGHEDEFPEEDEEERRHNGLKKRLKGDFPRITNTSLATSNPCRLIVHRVLCSQATVEGEDHQDHPKSADYLDVPRLFANDTRGSAVRGMRRLMDFGEFLEKNPDVCLVVYKHYSCTAYHRMIKDSFETMAAGIDRQVFNKLRPWLFSIKQDGGSARVKSENIEVTSEMLQAALYVVVASGGQRLAGWNVRRDLTAPYDYFYHFRRTLREQSAAVLSHPEQDLVDLLLDYIDESYGAAFNKVDTIFATGYVHRDYFTKLFGPDELVVTQQEGYHRAYIAERFSSSQKDTLVLDCWSWTFEGSFYIKRISLSVPWPDPDASTVPISSLAAWPLRLDSSDMQQRLDRRGREFWSCRHRRLVSYIAPRETVFELQTVRHIQTQQRDR